jgi:hypothetical protein
MMEHHPWAGIPHYRPDLISHFSFVAVDFTIGTNRFQIMKWTFVNFLMSMFSKNHTVCAYAIFGIVVCMTEHRNH